MNSRFAFVASSFLLILLLQMSLYKDVGASEKVGVSELPQLPEKHLQDTQPGWGRKLLGQVEIGGSISKDQETVTVDVEHKKKARELLRHGRIRNLLGRVGVGRSNGGGGRGGGGGGGGRPSSVTGGGNNALRPDNSKKNGAVSSSSVSTHFLLVALVVASFAFA